jgi:hypothetical protein
MRLTSVLPSSFAAGVVESVGVVGRRRAGKGWLHGNRPNLIARVKLFLGTWVDHSHYNNVDVNDAANKVRAVVGHTTCIVAP